MIVFEMAHKGVLMSIESDKTATPYPAETARRFFREIVLGIEYCKLFFLIMKKGPIFTITFEGLIDGIICSA